MITQKGETGETILLRLDPGEDLLQCLRQAVEENEIKNGIILSGLGSLKSYRLHVVQTTNLPPGNTFFGQEGPYDILSMNGLVIGGKVHAHITISDAEKAMGGHVEEGCEVLTFAMVVMANSPDINIAGWDQVGGL